MALERNELDALEELQRSFNNFAKAMGASGNHFTRFSNNNTSRRPGKKTDTDAVSEEQIKSLEKNIKAIDDTTKLYRGTKESLGDLTESTDLAAKGTHALYRDVVGAAKSMGVFEDESYAAAESLSRVGKTNLVPTFKRLQKTLVQTDSAMANLQRKNSLLATALMKSTLHQLSRKDDDEYYELLDTLKEKSKDFISRLSEKSKIVIQSEEDVDKVIAKVGQIRANVAQSLEGLDLKNFGGDFANLLEQASHKQNKPANDSEVGAITDIHQKAIIAAANTAKASGAEISDEHLEAAKNGDVSGLAKALNELVKAAKKTDEAFVHEIDVRDKLTYKLKDAISQETKSRLEALASFGGTVAAVKAFISSLEEIRKEASAFNVANIPRTFADVQFTSMKLGMSFEDTSKMMQDNKELMAVQGAQWEKNTVAMSDSFRQFGYTTKQMSELQKPLNDLAVVSGQNVRNGEGMAKFTTNTMNSFQKLNGVLGITAKEFMEFHTKILGSEEFLSSAIGMGKERAAEFTENVKDQANNQARLLGSLDKAVNVMAAEQKAKKEPALERLKQSVKLRQAATMAGMSDDEANRLAEITLKGEKNRTDKDSTDLKELSQKLGVNIEQARYDSTGNYASEAFYNTIQSQINDKTGENSKTLQASGIDIEARRRAGQIASPGEAAKAGQAATGSAAYAKADEALNMISSTINNSFVKAIGTASLALFALSGMAGKVALNMAGGFGNLANLLKGGGLFSTVSTAAGTAATVGTSAAGATAAGGAAAAGLGSRAMSAAPKFLKGAGVGLLGAGVDYAGDKLKENGYEKTGVAANVAGKALSYGATGAMLGSVIPVVGTAAGAALGATAGAAMGIYDNWSSISGPSKPVQASPASNNYTSPDAPTVGSNVNNSSNIKITSLDDATTKNIQDIAANTLLTAQILSQILENTGNTSKVGLSFKPATVRQSSTNM